MRIRKRDELNAYRKTHTFSKEISKMCEHPSLTKEEEIELGKKIQEGDEEALHKLVNCNIRLVASICKDNVKNDLYPFEEAMSNGFIGLMKAAKSFNPDKGVRFMTFAYWHIKMAVYKGQLHNRSGAVSIPQDGLSLVCRSDRGEDLGNRSLETVEKIRKAIAPVASIGRSHLVDDHAVDIRNYDPPAFPEEAHELLRETLPLLTKADQDVLSMRYGLGKYKEGMTYDQMSKILGITFEAARQRERNARERLKAVMVDQRAKCQAVPSES